jgi:hypothetical protein
MLNAMIEKRNVVFIDCFNNISHHVISASATIIFTTTFEH